jgi:hypothetical protein
MRKRTFLLLFLFLPIAFPLALPAQQLPGPLGTIISVSLLDDDLAEGDLQNPASLALNAAAGDITKMSPLPDAPIAPTEYLPAATVYRPTWLGQPEAAVQSEPVFNERFINKKFLAVHAVFLASIVYDAELTHQGLAHHKCVESNPDLGTHPSRGRIYGENTLAFSAISGLDWILGKTKIPVLPYVSPLVGTAVHLTGGSKWLTECW